MKMCKKGLTIIVDCKCGFLKPHEFTITTWVSQSYYIWAQKDFATDFKEIN